MTSVAVPKPPTPASRPAVQPKPRILGLFSPEGAVMAGLLTAAFVALYFRWFWTQHGFSSHQVEDWGHSYLIPVISGYMIWQQRDALARIPIRIFWPGLAPFLLGIMSYFFFVSTSMVGGHMVQGWAVLLTLFGLVLLMVGPAAIRYLFLPISILIFGITISEMVMLRLTFPLQLVASQGAYVVLNVIGVVGGFSADVNGNMLDVITSSGTPIELSVAEACAGMRTVVAFFALAATTAVLGCRFWWQRIALMMLAAPIAILINIGRVSVLGLLSLVDRNLAAGQAHTFIGMLLLIPGLLLFMGVVWVLNRAVREPQRGAS